MENSNVLSQKSGKSDCQTRVRQTIVGMNEEGCEQPAKIVGAAGKKILASR